MAGWRYIAERLNGDGTGTFLDMELPLSEVSIENSLSAPDVLNATISPEIARLKAPDGLPILQEWGTAIYAEKDGAIRGGGILCHSGFAKSTWNLECVGFMGYFKDMPYTGPGAFFVETDRLDIVRSIAAHVQSQPGSNIGLTFSGLKSGSRVGSTLESEEYDPEGGEGGLELESQAYKLAWYQDHDLLDNIQGLAESAPFDYRERHWWDGDAIRHHIDFGAPSLSRRREDLRFAVGENVFVTPEVTRDGAEYADEVYVLGAGEGAKMIRGRATAPRRGLRRVHVLSAPSLRTANRANAAAQSEVRWRNNMDNTESIIVRDTPHAPVGSVTPGDEIYVTGQAGWKEIDDWFRVTNVRIVPDNPGAMELAIRRSDRLAA